MRKYSFLVHHIHYQVFMDELKSLGVLHIIETDKEIPVAMQDEYRLVNDIEKTIKTLKTTASVEDAPEIVLPDSGAELHTLVKETWAELELLSHQYSSLEKEKRQLAPWGDFDWKTINALQTEGFEIRFFTCAKRKFNADWEANFDLFNISEEGANLFFVVITKTGDTLPEWEADEVKLPLITAQEVDQCLAEIQQKRVKCQSVLQVIAKQGVARLEGYVLSLRDNITTQMAYYHTGKEVEGQVMVLGGWVPKDNEAPLVAYLESNNLVYLSSDYKEGEKPPVLLKNNRFGRLFEMIGNLYSLPNYGELDLTPYLAPFYLLFFGFCFSDAGYGLLFVLVATILKFKSEKPNPILTLVQLLGGSTILFGILGGTFFGIDLYKTNLPIYSSLAVMLKESNITIQDIMFKASLGLGLIQILFGMFIRSAKLIKQQGILHAASTLGWAFLIISSALNYWFSAKGAIEFWNPIFIVIGGLCLTAIFFMNMPGKNLLLNFGAGLWDAYNTVVGGIGDLLSYVRLFALGLASGILGLVFNDLGTKLLAPDAGLMGQIFGYFAMILVLVVGHGINIFMSGLGSMVHPLRLTFVEFYKNAGFEGGGKPYNPFRKQTI